MKYLKKFEVRHNYIDESTDIEEDDYVVAYIPYQESDVVKPITIDSDNYVIEVGIVSKVFLKEKRGFMYSVIFPGSRYMRFKKHILYRSKDKEDAIQYAEMLKTAKKYNLG